MSLFKAKENVHVVYSGIWQTATILSVEKEVFCRKRSVLNQFYFYSPQNQNQFYFYF
jgi:hypothetical protein